MNNQMSMQEKVALAMRDLRKIHVQDWNAPERGEEYIILWQSPDEEGKILAYTGETDIRGRRVIVAQAMPFATGGRIAEGEKTFSVTGWVLIGDRKEKVDGIRLCLKLPVGKKCHDDEFEA